MDNSERETDWETESEEQRREVIEKKKKKKRRENLSYLFKFDFCCDS